MRRLIKLEFRYLKIFNMKLIITIIGITITEPINPLTNCGTINADFGVSVKCPYNAGYVVGFCSSGKNRDCNDGHHSHQYKCCEEHEISIDMNRCNVQYGHHGCVVKTSKFPFTHILSLI